MGYGCYHIEHDKREEKIGWCCMENTKTENKMGVMQENRLLLSMAVPIMLSMLVQALYNVVDSIFVSRLSEDALTAVSLAFPIQNLMIAVGSGIGVGMNALLSRSLGERNEKQANQAAVQSGFLIVIGYVIFLLVGIFGAGLFMKSQTEIRSIAEPGTTYLQICCCMSFGIFGQLYTERLLQATGRTIYTMVTQLVGAVINIILDPILIFGLVGFPRMEVAGAALATVIGQIVAACLGLFFQQKVNKEIRISLKGFRPHWATIKTVLTVGIPSMIMASIGSVMTYGMNLILMGFSSTAAAVFGVYFKIQSFAFMPTFGLNNGMVPIIAYNYGAKKKHRMVKTIKLSVMYAVIIMWVAFLTLQFGSETILGFFDASPDMIDIGIPALRTISYSFLMAGMCIVLSSVFQALGNGVYSMLVSICRQLVVLLPVAFLLSRMGEVRYVWWAFPIAEIMSTVLCIVFFIRTWKKVIKPLEEVQS